MKTSKVEKVPISNIANVVMEVLDEMLVLIAERTHCDNSNMGRQILFEFYIQNWFILVQI